MEEGPGKDVLPYDNSGPASALGPIADRLTVRQQVGVATAMLCLVLVVGVSTVAAYLGRQQARSLVATELAEHARTVADRLDRGIAARVADVLMLTELGPLRDVWTGGPEAVRPVLEQIRRKIEFSTWSGFVTPDGRVKAATGRLREGAFVGRATWFRQGRSGLVVDEVADETLLMRLAGHVPRAPKRSIAIAAPARASDGMLAGVLSIHLSWDWAHEVLRSTLARLQAGSETKLSIVSWDGRFLAAATGSPALPAPLLAWMHQQKSGSFVDRGAPEPILTSFAVTNGHGDFAGVGWIVIAQRPAQIAYRPADQVAWTILGWGFALGAAGLAAAIFIAGRVSGPIRTLAREADRIGRDPKAVTVSHVRGSVEIAQLSRAIRSLLRRIDLTEQAMATAETASAERTQQLTMDVHALQALAESDPMTGLPNRRGMLSFNDGVMSAYRRDGKAFAVLVIDIDHFKSVNDTYGHAFGDEVICSVAAAVRAALRPEDRIARFGGEEFVAVLRNVPLLRASEIAERARAAVEAATLLRGNDPVSVSVSVGVAAAYPGDRDVQDVVERADEALYEAKAAGRNRISIAARPQQAFKAA